MKHIIFVFFLPFVLAFDFVVGVGKDETTGKKGMGFDPSVIVPAVGDTIVLEFRSGAHSVLQSTFENPCSPMQGGFNSGVQNTPDSLDVDAPGLKQIRLTVNDTNPLWFYDEAGGLCHKGAVLAANPSGSQTAAQFKENALKAPATQVAPSTLLSSSVGSSQTSSASSAIAASASESSKPKNASYRDGASVVAVLFGLLVGLL